MNNIYLLTGTAFILYLAAITGVFYIACKIGLLPGVQFNNTKIRQSTNQDIVNILLADPCSNIGRIKIGQQHVMVLKTRSYLKLATANALNASNTVNTLTDLKLSAQHSFTNAHLYLNH